MENIQLISCASAVTEVFGRSSQNFLSTEKFSDGKKENNGREHANQNIRQQHAKKIILGLENF